ncbi:T9SS type A sorting domain-containing protein [Winogradskyella alexanderae]|uniref:T9SS type A sorting domain-containing protein n=1 Tax=Winogradskyella alexanderae TaxID=2877123 RepID=A0ABS7XQR4_9FLAO|nr:T9SS type A sorting domain-containing protein [Winogradskyella alexanderae]MCA0132350.1 T9SS type A sorting domain-containing protein [Winogradskyella alexanderae]
MAKKYLFILLFVFSLTISAQEVINLSGYDGSTINVTATSTVNDDITIIFEDVDIINNFYTDFQTEIYMYGGLDTSSGGFQGAPDFGDLGAQPVLSLFGDSDVNAGPNTYSITINLAQQYSAVPDGTEIFGFNLLFQNQFSGGGNNQTTDLYINLIDALKDSTLNTPDFEKIENLKAHVSNKLVTISGSNTINTVSIFNILGQNVYNRAFNNASNVKADLSSEPRGVYIVRINSDLGQKTLKVLLN